MSINEESVAYRLWSATTGMSIKSLLGALVCVLLTAAPAVAGPTYSGRIDEIEVWANGNVDFTLLPAQTDCGQGRFVINKSIPGAAHLIAAIYMAKSQDRPIRIYSYGCIVAENYGSTANWIGVDYLYVQQ